MRKFYFQNDIGERIDLNGTPYLLTSPSGLGLSYSVSQASVDKGFYKETKLDFPASQIMGDINIIEDMYAEYRTLVDWLNNGHKVTFVYDPKGNNDEYYCDIQIQTLSKTEITDGNILVCTFVALARTPWYKPRAKIINIVPDAVEQSTFDLTWDIVWSNDATAGETAVTSEGHLPAAIKATIDGALYNPKIQLLDNGNVIAEMVLGNTTINVGHVLTYSSLYTDSGVWIDGVSALSALDLANENFFRIPLGKTYTLRITSEQSVTITGSISIYDYYRSV